MKRLILLGLILVMGLTACSSLSPETSPEVNFAGRGPGNGMRMRMGRGMGGMGMGPNRDMQARHMAPIPDEYAGQLNPITADEQSLLRGEEIYAASCAACHGDGGMGDGPAGAALDPAPSAVAHTSQMMGDDYLFWRISEGGALDPFSSTMPAWKAVLDEQARWDVTNYLRALGSGQVVPRRGMGGAAFDPNAEEALRAEMLAKGIETGLFSQQEVDIFDQVHDAIEQNRGSLGQGQFSGNPMDMQTTMLSNLVSSGEVSEAQVNTFVKVRDKLFDAGLMQ